MGAVSQEAQRETIAALRDRYVLASKSEKGRMPRASLRSSQSTLPRRRKTQMLPTKAAPNYESG